MLYFTTSGNSCDSRSSTELDNGVAFVNRSRLAIEYFGAFSSDTRAISSRSYPSAFSLIRRRRIVDMPITLSHGIK